MSVIEKLMYQCVEGYSIMSDIIMDTYKYLYIMPV